MSKTALVTGAGRGIGRAIAEQLASAGYDVVLVARSQDELDAVRDSIRNAGGVALSYPCDLAQADEIAALARDLEIELERLDVLVHNAGVAPSAPLHATTDAMWRETFDINVNAPFYLTRALATLLQSSHGHVIAIGSTASLSGFKYNSAYTASKHALLGLMRALAAELPSVWFSTLCPGFVRTSVLTKSIARIMEKTGRSEAEAEAAFAKLNREGRVLEPSEVADAVVRLLLRETGGSGAAYYLDGTVVGA